MKASRSIALGCFWLYVVLFPGSTLTLALGQVPAWGTGMGGLLLLIQGLAAAAWLVWAYGRRGALAGLGTVGLAWACEHIGETSGWPFGRYEYTNILAPQIAGVVPLPIVCAWLMVALGAWQLAGRLAHGTGKGARGMAIAGTATLILVLDLQIETIATRVNRYWRWVDQGQYYGVPTTNFSAWWLVGLLMATVLMYALWGVQAPMPASERAGWRRVVAWPLALIPALLYLLSTLMFTIINLVYGYTLAGLVGVVALALVGAWLFRRGRAESVFAAHQTSG
jgi:putative membrane protein